MDHLIPNSLISQLNSLGGRTAVTQTVETALRRILNGTRGERMAMMQAALTYRGEPHTPLPPCDIDNALESEFINYCREKNLRGNILLTGALLTQLGDGQLSDPNPIEGCHGSE